MKFKASSIFKEWSHYTNKLANMDLVNKESFK